MVKTSRKIKVILILIIFAGFFLRFYELTERFNFDAELNVKAWTIKSLVVDHKFPLVGIEAVSYLHHLFYPPLFQYVGGVLFLISKLNPLSIEIALIFLFLPSVLLIYKVASRLFDRKTGVIASFIYSFSFFINIASRFIWVVGPLLAISLAILFIIQKMSENAKSRILYIFLIGALLAFGFNFHFQIGVIFVSIVIWFFLYKRRVLTLKTIVVFLLPIFIAFSPLVIFDLRHNFFNLRGILLFLSGNKTGSLFSNLLSANLIFAKTFLSVLSETYASRLQSHVIAFTINSLILFFSSYSAFRLNLHKKRIVLNFIFINFLFAFIVFPFMQNKFYETKYYLFFLLPYFVIIFSYFIRLLIKKSALGGFFVLCLFLLVNIDRYQSHRVIPNYQTKKTALEKIIRQNSKKKNLVIYSSDLASEKYSFLLYLACRKLNYDYGRIQIFEPWNKPIKYDVVIDQKTFL